MATVMVVDDTLVIRETVAKLLKREGYDTICVGSGREALDALKSSDPDLMLLDIMMPEMDGMECLSLLRRDARWRELPVIIMSALSDEEHQKQAQELGASDYLVKARFTISQILERVRDAMGKKGN
jgi:two-component system sensor histidine kinase and response regulator WspE